jgi:hypothetical protein
MAIYRKIHVSFWADPFIMDLTPEQKLFFLYLLTNDQTKQCGIYELPVKKICFDTGYDEATVKKLINFFVEQKKIKYSANFREIAVKNWNKYNGSNSPTVFECIRSELQEVKDEVLIQYVYSMGKVDILRRNNNKNNNKNKQKNKGNGESGVNIPFDIFWDLYDKRIEKYACKTKWNNLTDAEREKIIEYIPKYKISQPEKKYRKNPETFLNNKSWEDEIIENKINGTHQQPLNGSKQTGANQLLEKLRSQSIARGATNDGS